MSDFAPPTGPPPPKVPEGWKAIWNDQYKEWFYVNLHTKASQWIKPTEPVYPSAEGAPPGPPPGYPMGSNNMASDAKTNPYDTKQSVVEDDAALAARLQAEEDARAGGTRNAQQDYLNTPMPPQGSSSPYQELPPREQKKGFLGKLLGKASGPSSSNQYPAAGYGQNQYRPPQQAYGYGAPPPQQYGGYPPQQGYGSPGYGAPGYGPPGGAYGGGYQQPPKRAGGGIGAMGGAALGLGGGLIGGMLLEDAIQDHDQGEYQQGYDQGMDNNNGGDYGGGGGGDFGGGDMGGGDF